MLKQTKKLFDLGFAIHWLKPKSKMPVESKWTTGERKSWAYLEKTYTKGLNVGVRLGQPSKINGGYLAVIDVDVKSEDPKHRKEAYDRVKRLFGNEFRTSVRTGRGNGSLHYYGYTPTPVATRRLGQSNDVVRVKMPSSDNPSKRERTTLTVAELAKGLRLRPAWEVSIMGTGSQVVLPPSIHPDTGKEYQWASNQPASASELPLFTFADSSSESDERPDTPENTSKELQKFQAEEIDLIASSLPNKTKDLILSGAGCEDRSAALFSVAILMIKHGFTDNQIMSVLTDQSTFLGEAAYEHAKTENRVVAANWIKKYTIVKAHRETDAKFAFENEVELSPLSDEDAEAQKIELVEQDWREQIERTGPVGNEKPKGTMKNVFIILRGEFENGLFTENEFSGLQLYTCDTPWGGKRGAEVSDKSVTRLKKWFADKYRFEPSTDKIGEAITVLAAENSFHPVKDYLNELEWDGRPRINSWVRDYHKGVAAEPYLAAISRKTLVAMIARIYEPGCKFDTVPILEGPQGVGKSTAVSILAGEWFSDAHINISDKDGVLSMRGVWIIELGELSGMRKADVDLLKEFTSRRVDRIRVPYGRRTENFARQSIFIGTTNSSEYLKDITGNRRFWPVKVGKCDFDSLKRDRDQLLAEAKFYYDNLGEVLYLDAGENKAAESEQESRMIHDVWIDKLSDFFSKQDRMPEAERFNIERFRMLDLFGDFVNVFDGAKGNQVDQKRCADALKKLNYENRVVRMGDKIQKLWVRK